eukprot:Blabericola_migrator_1__161@NODE_1041_length_5625_cov_143_923893_g717_i0_p2_GENE_NODE_1041_length_5625_cov_143_923893_g717_i0NODE_1041_length_5625_cov_143_923893_g717_i0_p2_ORF_typecomplete_len351_score54_98FHA/PF00498_26/1_6e15YopYscD_cpl/PF16697_5/2_4e10_NODE_1041_length_5625_cov_143_923893_g717_i029203972
MSEPKKRRRVSSSDEDSDRLKRERREERRRYEEKVKEESDAPESGFRRRRQSDIRPQRSPDDRRSLMREDHREHSPESRNYERSDPHDRLDYSQTRHRHHRLHSPPRPPRERSQSPRKRLGPPESSWRHKEDHRRRSGGTQDEVKEEVKDEYPYARYEVKKERSSGPKPEKKGPDYNVSGVLREETSMRNGVLLKFDVPFEARKPTKKWKLFVFKSQGQDSKPIKLDYQRWFLIGKHAAVADILLNHPTVSAQHAAVCHQIKEDGSVQPFLWDLGSTNGTYVNGTKLEPFTPVELKEKDIITFAKSTREYVLLHDDLVETKEVPLEQILENKLAEERQEKARTARLGRYW